MKLLEFLEIIRENDSSEHGTFVGARLTRDSERAIMRWMRDNGLRKKEPRARLHITVVGDKEQSFDWNPATFEPPLEIDPGSYRIEKFNEGAIVLTFSVPELEKRHKQAIEKYGINWKFPTYQPHITLSYDPTELNDTDRLLMPTFPMYVANEYVQPWGFSEGDSSSDRRRTTRVDEALLFERNVMNSSQVDVWAKTIADGMFGTNMNAQQSGSPHEADNTVEVLHKWAQKALRKHLINDAPAPRINSFQPDADSYPYPGKDVVGTANLTWPEDPATFGIFSGHTKDKNITAPPWLPNALERGEEVYWLDERFMQANQGSFGSVRDWFRHLAGNAPEQLSPARLNRLSWPQAEEAAFAWHDQMKASEYSDYEEDEGDRELYLEVGGGSAWWKLTGPSCLNREGDLMGHCVADYAEDVENGHAIILSLRDSKNNPHVTIELTKNTPWAKNAQDTPVATTDIAQVKGKENKPPVEKYWKYVDEVIKKLASEGRVGVSGEGQQDLRECQIEKLGPMLIRTEPPFWDTSCVVAMVQYPKDREWSIFDHEEMELWEAFRELTNRDIIPEEEHFTFSATDENEIVQYIRWVLIRDGEWNIETYSHIDEQFYHDNKDFEYDPDNNISVPTTINIKVPDIKYDILVGSPEGYQLDIKHALASRESLI